MSEQTHNGQTADRPPTPSGRRSVARRQSIQDFALSSGLSPRKVLRYVTDELEAVDLAFAQGKTFDTVLHDLGVHAWRQRKGGRVKYDVVNPGALTSYTREREGVRLSAQEAANIARMLNDLHEVSSVGDENGFRVCGPAKGYGDWYRPITISASYLTAVKSAINNLSHMR